jgi:hypothetical protein
MLKHFYVSQMLFLSKHRGRASYYLYTALATAVLAGKRIWFRFLFKKTDVKNYPGASLP